MTLTLITIPCLEDNYAFLIGNEATGEAAVVDFPQAAPIEAALAQTRWRLTTLLITHHHWDHVDGLPDYAGAADLTVIGSADDAHRLPPLTKSVREGDRFQLCGEEVQVFDVSGHTINHIAFYLPGAGLAFTADSLMSMGCGRLSEGTPAQMWQSLQKLRSLPPETTICSGHEYTLTNARFAMTLEDDNPRVISRHDRVRDARERGVATVPTSLQEEIETNPFLRADDPVLMTAIGMADADPTDVFAEIRSRRNKF